MKNRSCSFLSRLVLPGLMSLILLSPAIARADTIAISVDFGGGFTGIGSFNTDGTCVVCRTFLNTLTNFVFTVDDDTFNQAAASLGNLTYNRTDNELQFAALESDDAADALEFRPVGTGVTNILFQDNDDAPGIVEANATVSLVPEPSSLVLLAGGIGWLVLGLRRRATLRPKSFLR